MWTRLLHRITGHLWETTNRFGLMYWDAFPMPFEEFACYCGAVSQQTTQRAMVERIKEGI